MYEILFDFQLSSLLGGSRSAESCGNSRFNFFEELELPNCFPKQLSHFTFPPATYRGFISSPTLVISCFRFDYSHPNRCEVVSH